MTRTIIQCAKGAGIPLQKMVAPYHEAWCFRNGYKYQVDYLELCASRNFFWEKIVRIRNWLRDAAIGDYGFWLDMDCLMIRGEPLEVAMNGKALAMSRFAGGGFCGGVIFIKCCEETRKFFQDVWDLGQPNTECPLFGQHEEYRINEVASYNKVEIEALNSRWNFGPKAPDKAELPIQIYAWHAMPLNLKYDNMRKFLEGLRWPLVGQ